MGFLDDLKDKAEDFGDKAKEGLGAAKEKASDLVDDVKDRFDGDDDTPATDTTESTDAAPSVGEVPDAGLGNLSDAPVEGLTPVDDGAGQLGSEKDESGPA